MLVLDEQLLGRGLDVALRRWYRGSIVFITDLRPGSVIKDDAIPQLLRQRRKLCSACLCFGPKRDAWGWCSA